MERREHPFPCRIVRHRGARRMTLRVGPAGARLTVPARARARAIDAFLHEHRAWAKERLAAAAGPPPLRAGDRVALLDEVLELATGARTGRDGGRLRVRPAADGSLDGPVERWYRRAAHAEMAPRAERLAAELGREVARVGIRDGRSRWGSCTTAGRLSFSWRLMLAPEPVLDYVVVHEVCHLVQPDHSPAFWALVAALRPGHAAERRWLRDNGERLRLGPAWRSISPV